jgi:hypothetical protein
MVFLDDSSSGRANLSRIGQVEALTALLEQSMNFAELPAAGLAVLLDLVRSTTLLKLSHGDLEGRTRLLTETLP